MTASEAPARRDDKPASACALQQSLVLTAWVAEGVNKVVTFRVSGNAHEILRDLVWVCPGSRICAPESANGRSEGYLRGDMVLSGADMRFGLPVFQLTILTHYPEPAGPRQGYRGADQAAV